MPAANMLTHDYEAGRLYLECGTPLTLQSLRCAVQDALKLAMDYQRDIGAWEDGWILSRKEPRIAVRMLDVRVLQPLRDVMDEYHGETSSEGSTRLRQIGSGSERDTRSVGTLKSDKGSDKGSESHHSERGEHGTSERGESSTTPTLPSQQKEDEKDASSGSSVERPKHSVLLARQSQERHREGHSMTDNSQQNSPKIEHRKEAKTKSTNDTHNNRSRRVDKGKPLQHPRVDSLRSREVLLDALELMTMYFHKLCASDDFVPNARTRDIIWRLLKALKGMPGCSNYSTPDRAVRRRLFEAGRAIWSCMYPNSKCIPKIAGITIREGFFTFTSWTTFVATCIFFGVPFVTHDVVTRPGNDRRMAWDTLGWTILVAFLLSVAVSVTRFVRHKMNLLRLRKEVTLVADDVLFKELYDYLYIKERVRRSLRFQVMTHTWPFLGMEGGTVRKLLIKKILDGRDFAFQLMAAAVAVLVIEFLPFGDETFQVNTSSSKTLFDTLARGTLVGRVYSFLIIVVFILSLVNYIFMSQLMMVIPSSDPERLPMILGVLEDLELFLWISALANSGSMLALSTAAYLIAVVNYKVGRVISAIPIATIIALFYMLGSRVRWLFAQTKLDECDLD